MLLVFTPALYCDTSDSWMLPNRFSRAAVGLAGIATEVGLAAIATIVWAYTAPGILHYVAMNVMLVCSVSTVMFNANPLLRYDGYYVLSDLCDVPNLGERSKKLLSAHVNQLIFGFDDQSDEPISTRAHIGLLAYGAMSFVYRWMLTLVILWFVSLILRPYRLESIGRVLAIFAIGGMLFALMRGPYQFLRNPARRRMIRMKRTTISILVSAILMGCCFIPLPSGLSITASIHPRGETPVYVSTAGQLQTLHKHPGGTVVKGDPIATLSNPDVELQLLKTQGRYDTQALIVQSLKRAALNTPDAVNDLPGQEAMLADLAKRLESRRARRDGLVIKAPADGHLISGPRRNEDSAADEEMRLVSWSGFPTDVTNQDCFLESGSELLSVVAGQDWDAEIVLLQSQVQRIVLGAKVKLVLESLPSETFVGTVVDISRSQWDGRQHADRRDDPGASRHAGPPSTSYLVNVELDSDVEIPMVTGASAAGRIEAEPSSLAARAMRTINSLIRFQ